jgi:hypothetical protein
MGKRSQRLYGCRVGMHSRGRCRNSAKEKVTLVCQHGHCVTMWICDPHLKTLRRRYLLCKACDKLGRQDIKCRQMPLVADLPLRFRTLDAQFDSE